MHLSFIRSCCLVMTGLAIIFGGLSSALAEFVKPTGVVATSFWFYGDEPSHIIDGSGLSSEDAFATHAQGFGDIWHADSGYATFNGGGVVANQSLIFTLPGIYDLTQAHIWQLNQPPDYAGRGVNQYDLLVSSDGVNYVPVITDGTLLPSGSGPIAAQSPSFSLQSNVRFVKLQIDSAQSGNAIEYVGLSEVRFEGTKTGNGPVCNISKATSNAGLPMQPSGSDLLQGKIGTSNLTTYGGAGIDQLTNGVGDADNNHRAVPNQNGGIWQVSYDATQLGLGVNETLNLNRINVFTFSHDTDFVWNADISRRYSDFDVWYRTTDGGQWQALLLGATSGYVNDLDMTLTSIGREDLQDILIGVRELRFDFRPVTSYDGIAGNEWHSGIVEIDVLGNVATPLTGDFDGDGDVDGADFIAWQTNFPTTSGANSQMGDADGDSDVDGADFAAWQNSFPSGPGGGATPIPEPVSMVLLLLGGAITLGRYRFKVNNVDSASA